jgi:hypothetical protein
MAFFKKKKEAGDVVQREGKKEVLGLRIAEDDTMDRCKLP